MQVRSRPIVWASFHVQYCSGNVSLPSVLWSLDSARNFLFSSPSLSPKNTTAFFGIAYCSGSLLFLSSASFFFNRLQCHCIGGEQIKRKEKSIEKPEGQIQSFHFSNFRSSLFGKIEIVQTVGLKMIKILFGWLNVNFLSLSSAYVLYIILWYCFGPNVAVLFVCRRVPSSQEYFA